MISRFCQPIWESVIGDALNRDIIQLPRNKVVNWRNVHWQGPQSLTIDKGRDGQLYQGMVNSGMLARSEWHEATGKHGRNHRQRIINELAEDIEYCNSKKVPIELYFGTHPGQIISNATTSNDAEKTAKAVVNLLEENAMTLR